MLHWSEAANQPYTVGLRLVSHPRLPLIQLLTDQYSFVTAFLTGLFLWPVMRNSFQNNRARRLAVRTIWAALVALTTSCVNILVLTLMHGRQLGWVCLASCGTDVSSRTYWISNTWFTHAVQVIINALAIYWVALQSSGQSDRMSKPLPNFTSLSKSEDPETGGADPSTKRRSKVAFKLGHSKQDSPTSLGSIQVTFARNLLPRSAALSLPFRRSKSLPSELRLTNTANHLSTSRSTSCGRCPLFHKAISTKYRKKIGFLTLSDGPLFQ